MIGNRAGRRRVRHVARHCWADQALWIADRTRGHLMLAECHFSTATLMYGMRQTGSDYSRTQELRLLLSIPVDICNLIRSLPRVDLYYVGCMRIVSVAIWVKKDHKGTSRRKLVCSNKITQTLRLFTHPSNVQNIWEM